MQPQVVRVQAASPKWHSGPYQDDRGCGAVERRMGSTFRRSVRSRVAAIRPIWHVANDSKTRLPSNGSMRPPGHNGAADHWSGNRAEQVEEFL